MPKGPLSIQLTSSLSLSSSISWHGIRALVRSGLPPSIQRCAAPGSIDLAPGGSISFSPQTQIVDRSSSSRRTHFFYFPHDGIRRLPSAPVAVGIVFPRGSGRRTVVPSPLRLLRRRIVSASIRSRRSRRPRPSIRSRRAAPVHAIPVRAVRPPPSARRGLLCPRRICRSRIRPPHRRPVSALPPSIHRRSIVRPPVAVSSASRRRPPLQRGLQLVAARVGEAGAEKMGERMQRPSPCCVLCSALLQLMCCIWGSHIWAKVMLFWACTCTASAVAFICF